MEEVMIKLLQLKLINLPEAFWFGAVAFPGLLWRREELFVLLFYLFYVSDSVPVLGLPFYAGESKITLCKKKKGTPKRVQ